MDKSKKHRTRAQTNDSSQGKATGFRMLTLRNLIITLAICVIGLMYFGLKDTGTATSSGFLGIGAQTYECGSLFNAKKYETAGYSLSGSASLVNKECNEKRLASVPGAIIFGLPILIIGWSIRNLLEDGEDINSIIQRIKDGS